MTGPADPIEAQDARVSDASDWFARMKGPGSANSQREFDRWMQDPRNGDAYRQIETVWLLAGRASPRSPAPLASEARRWWHVAAMAAAIVGCVTLASLLQLDSAPDKTIESVSYAAPATAIRRVRLADGSTLTLDAGTRLAARFDDDLREVSLLEGRARFAVAHDASRPFVVLVGERAVVATGTVFDVQVRQTDVEVTLIEGGVDVELRARNHTAVRLGRLRPGQSALIGLGSKLMLRPSPSGGTAWTSGLLSAEGLPLREVVAEANRYGSRKIVLADPALGQLRISGAFRLFDIEDLANQLAAALDLRTGHRQDGTIVLS